MIRDKKEFKETMYDYSNINEYYSFYGDVIYISSDYILQKDYFIILKNNTKFAFILIKQNEHQRFLEFKNRDHSIEELTILEKNISFTEGFENFIGMLNWHLLNTVLENRSKNELIGIKNNPLMFWNLLMIGSMIELHRIPKTLGSKPIIHEERELNRDIWISKIQIINAYNTNFNIIFDSVMGNSFMDIEIHHFNYKFKRRLFIYDIIELSQLLQTMAKNDEYKTLEILRAFQL